MVTPKRPTKEQVDANRRKQQVLKTAGYDVKVDGSWGPWQEQQYRKVIATKSKPIQANIGVLSIPAASAVSGSLLQGLGVTLPTISASSAAAALPVSLVAGPLAVEVYNQRHGIIPKIEVSPEERQQAVYSSDATGVSTDNLKPEFEVVTEENNQQQSNNEGNNENKFKKKIREIQERFSKKGNKGPEKKRELGKKALKFYGWSWGLPVAGDIIGNTITAMSSDSSDFRYHPKLFRARSRIERGLAKAISDYYSSKPYSTVTDTTRTKTIEKPQTQSDTILTPTLDSLRQVSNIEMSRYLDSLGIQ